VKRHERVHVLRTARVRPPPFTLLDRALARELLFPLAVGLFALLQLLLVAQLLQLNEVVFGPAVSLVDLARVTFALGPHFLVAAIPTAYMLGVQLALGRMAGDNELLALASAGRSPLALFKVPLLVACLLGLGTAALARWAEPWGLRELHRVLNDVIKRNLGSGVVAGVFNEELPRFTIYVAGVDDGVWKGVLIEDDVGDGAPLLALAEEGRIVDAQGEALTVALRRGELHRLEPRGESVARFAEGELLVGVHERVWRKNRFYGTHGALSTGELAAQARDADSKGDRVAAARLRVELARRWAVPLACLAFALLGVPLAVRGGGARGWAYLITLGAFVSFYVLGRVGDSMAERGTLPPFVAAFLPDLAVAALGASLTWVLLRRGVQKVT
jgi:lipopolysaccharide export system permease protein